MRKLLWWVTANRRTTPLPSPAPPFLRSPTESLHHPIPIHNPHSHSSPIFAAFLLLLLFLVCFLCLGTIASVGYNQGIFSFFSFLNFGFWASILFRVLVGSWMWVAMPVDGCGGVAWHGLWMIFRVVICFVERWIMCSSFVCLLGLSLVMLHFFRLFWCHNNGVFCDCRGSLLSGFDSNVVAHAFFQAFVQFEWLEKGNICKQFLRFFFFTCLLG